MSAAEPLIPAEQRDAGESNAGDFDVGDFDPTAINAFSRDLFFFSLEERPHAVDRRARAERGEFNPVMGPDGSRGMRTPKQLGRPPARNAGTGVGAPLRQRGYGQVRPAEQFNARIDPDVKAAVQERARLGNQPLGFLVENVLRDYLERVSVAETRRGFKVRSGPPRVAAEPDDGGRN